MAARKAGYFMRRLLNDNERAAGAAAEMKGKVRVQSFLFNGAMANEPRERAFHETPFSARPGATLQKG